MATTAQPPRAETKLGPRTPPSVNRSPMRGCPTESPRPSLRAALSSAGSGRDLLCSGASARDHR
eukprot:7359962-Pyramimonas_sp.AAC.1